MHEFRASPVELPEMGKGGVFVFGSRWNVLLIFALLSIVFIAGSFEPVVYDETEGQYSGAAREMLARGDWLLPTNNQLPRLQKPPLVYWCLMAGMSVFGKSEFGVRLPVALATVAWVFSVYLLGRAVGGRRFGLAGALLLASSCGFFVFTHVIMPEVFLALFITLTFWAMLRAWQMPENRVFWTRLAWVFMGVGSMCKGLHGALWPLLAVAVSALWDKNSRPFWKAFLSVEGPLIIAVILLPWYGLMQLRCPGFIQDHFINEQLGHAVDKRWPPSSNQVGLLVFVLQHFFMLMPGMLLLPAALVSLKSHVPKDPELWKFSRMFLGGAFLVILLTSMTSARQDYYTMAGWPVLTLLLAFAVVEPRPQARVWYFLPFVCLLAAGLAGAGFVLWLVTRSQETAAAVTPLVERDHLLTALQGFSMGAWLDFMPLIRNTSLSLLLGGVAGLWLVWRRKLAPAFAVLMLSMLVPYFMAVRGFAVKQDFFSMENSAVKIESVAQPDAMVVYDGYPNLASSLFFYLNRQVYWYGVPLNYEYATRNLGLGRELYLQDDSLKAAWDSPRQVFLIIEQSAAAVWEKRLSLAPGQMKPFSTSGTRVVLTNHPIVK
ncbi:MAG: glycosyltransferase family 39 protein [Methylacidiphilales bacterium]|nr:glycosyltransferase family 39 protein [Candidatus Methylacidiphilales bacterium]